MAKLVVNKGKSNERTVPLEFETTTVGRASDNVVVLPELYVSRQHLIIEKRPAGYFLHNLSGTTGTMVNQKKVDEAQLNNGDVIMVGETTLHFEIEPMDERTMLLEQPTLVMETPPEPPAPALAAPLPASVCPKCKNKVRPDDVYCGSCGASLKAAAPAPPPPSRPPAAPGVPSREPSAAPPSKEPSAPPAGAVPPPARSAPPATPRVPPVAPPPLRPSAPTPPRPSTHGAVRPASGAGNYLHYPKAGFGGRLIAYIIDSIILTVIGFILVGLPMIIFMIPAMGAGMSQRGEAAAGALGVLGFLVMMVGMVVYMVVAILYLLWYWAKKGYTPGKKMMGLRVITQSGECPIGWGPSFLRLIGYLVNGMIMNLGFLFILFDGEKRGLHDMIAKTYVVKIN